MMFRFCLYYATDVIFQIISVVYFSLGGVETSPGGVSMEPSWKHADVFPIIARIIDESHQQGRAYLTAKAIATRLVGDREGRPLIEQARQQLDGPHSLEWLASNMVAWFSQRITVGESEWDRAVERTRIEGQWAYRPVTAAGS
jgi:hypothetical protein